MDVTPEQLIEAYGKLGWLPLPTDPFAFRRSDGRPPTIVHDSFVGGLSLEFILEDVAKYDVCLADQLADVLFSLLEN